MRGSVFGFNFSEDRFSLDLAILPFRLPEGRHAQLLEDPPREVVRRQHDRAITVGHLSNLQNGQFRQNFDH